MKLALLKIPVHDLEAAIKFYAALFATEPVFAAEAYGWAQFDLGGLPLALYVPGMGGGDRAPGGSVDFHLATSGADALAGRLSDFPDAGAGTFENADGSRSFECRDPSGNLLKIMG
ncbi:MAG: VOC family protein [Pseudomonadota bacterium]